MSDEFERTKHNLCSPLYHQQWVFFGGGRKKVTLPAQPSPAPTAQSIDIEAQRKAEDIRRKLKARAGRAGTIITEGGLGTVEIGKNILLGGNLA